MTITPGPYLWRMRPEDEYRVVEVFHDKNNGAMFCMTGSNYTHRPTYGHEFVRLVPAEEVEKAWDECAALVAPGGIEWMQSRARRVATGDEQ